MSARRLSPDREAEFIRLARDHPDDWLAEYFGMGETTARRWRLRLAPDRTPLPRKKGIDEVELRAHWGKLHKRELAKHLGVCVTTVSRRAMELGLGGTTYHAVKPILTGDALERFIRLVSDPRLKVSAAAEAVGLTVKTAARLRRELGFLRKPGPKKGMRRYMRELGEAQRRIVRHQPDRPLAVIRWRCWRCELLNTEALCRKCGNTFGEPERKRWQ